MIYLGKNIKLYRMLKGYSQENLANYLKKSQNWVSGIESGRISISLDSKNMICGFLGISIFELENVDNMGNVDQQGTITISEPQVELREIKSMIEELKSMMKTIKKR